MRLLTTILFAFLILRGQLSAQKTNALNVESPFLIERHFFNKNTSLSEAKYMTQIHEKIGTTHQLRLLSSQKDELGIYHRKYQQYYLGFRVENAVLNVHIKDGYVYLTNGELFKIRALDGSTKLSVKQAEDIAWNQYSDGQKSLDTLEKGLLVWVPLEGNFKNEFRLAYKFDIYSHNPLKRDYVYVDANTGNILWMHHRIHEVTTDGTAKTKYSGTQTLKIDSLGTSNFRLHDYIHGNGIVTLNLNHSTMYSSATDYTNSSKSWLDTTANKHAAYDIHWGTQKTCDYYKLIHGRNGVDNANMLLESFYPYSSNFVNAFWDGSRMTYGEGNVSLGFTPLTSLEIIGHEITHGVTQHTAGLVYSDEYGALNESFSDIFGKCIEYSAKPSSFTWIIGKEVTTSGLGIRNMENPKQFSMPNTYGGQYWNATNDVHTNSSIQNLWFRILSMGKTGSNDLGNTYSVSSIGMNKAEKIAYRNLAYYLTPYSEYVDARMYSIQSAEDLYGTCSNEVLQTTNAWYAVGVGNIYSTTLSAKFSSQDSVYCSVLDSIQFTNLSTGASTYMWYFGDGGTSTSANPTHKYTNFGTYTVKLVIANCNNTARDSITKMAYIKIDSTLGVCQYIKFPDTGTINLFGCDYTIVDNGGVSGNYSNNMNSKIVLNNTTQKRYRIHVYSTDITSPDYLRFYNGILLNSSRQFYSMTGSYIPNDFASDSSRITLSFYSNNLSNNKGFKIRAQCINEPPSVNFSAQTTYVCADSTYFVNTTTPNADTVSYLWSFGDGSFSTAKNPVHKYTTSGYFNVKLRACNSYGCDSVTFYSFIYNEININTCGGKINCGGSSTNYNCSGILLDDGGSTNNYSNNCISTWSNYASSSNILKIKFNQFKLAAGDTLILIDGYLYGTNTILGRFTASNPPIINSEYTTSSSQFNVQFKSNNTLTDSGFILRYRCLERPLEILDIIASDSVSCSNYFSFTPNYNGNYNNVLWDYGDGSTSTGLYGSHYYNTPGLYTIKLTMCNNSTCDTLIKPNYILYDTSQINCANIIPFNTYSYLSNSCTGYIVDNGRRNVYSNNSNGNFVLSNYSGYNYRYRFSQLKLKPNDTLYVYSYYTDELLAKYSGNTIPNGGAFITTNASSVRFNFVSDATNVDSGFVIEYQCIEPSLSSDFSASDSIICQGYTYLQSKMSSSNWIYYWYFGDGSEEHGYYANNVYHTYSDTGYFTVKLKVCNSLTNICDSTTKTNYIQYLPHSNKCLYTETPTSSIVYVNKCSGFVTDNGNINHDYSNNVNGYVTVWSPNYYPFQYRFTQMKLALGDSLIISDNLGNSIGRYSGTTLPNGGNFIQTNSTYLYIKFYTNSSGVDSGFVLEYQCVTPPIDAEFSSNDTLTCSGYCNFQPKVNNYNWTYFWDFGDGQTYTGLYPSHYYTSSGTYVVKLVVCDNNGTCDSVIKSGYIVYDPDNLDCLYDVMDYNQYKYIYKCKGYLVDNGGAYNDYKMNSYDYAGFSSPTSARYRVKFKQFRLADGDRLIISDNMGYYQVFSGESLPNDGDYISLGNTFNVYFSSISSNTDSGFIMLYECYDPYNVTADFKTKDINSCGSVQYVNLSTSADSYFWDFGDGSTSTDFEPVHIYNSNGTYSPKLKAYSQYSSDEMLKQDYINIQKLKALFSSKDTLPTGITILNNTSNSATNYKWYLDNVYKTNISNFNQNVTTSGLHKIRLTSFNSYCKDSFEKLIYFTKKSSIDNSKSETYVHLFPSPSKGEITLSIYSRENSYFQTQIYDMQGRLVKSYMINVVGGNHQEVYHLEFLSNGKYWIKLSNEREEFNAPFEIIK